MCVVCWGGRAWGCGLRALIAYRVCEGVIGLPQRGEERRIAPLIRVKPHRLPLEARPHLSHTALHPHPQQLIERHYPHPRHRQLDRLRLLRS